MVAGGVPADLGDGGDAYCAEAPRDHLHRKQHNMKKLQLGLVSGTLLGLLDGFSAFFVPSAAGMMTTIMIGSTAKGIVGGLAAGLIARRSPSVWTTTLWSGVAGAVLSVLSAIPSGAYAHIVIPGTIAGVLTGAITHKWGR